MGCDARITVQVVSPDIVSIHAPAWGATRGIMSVITTPRGFNPRTRVGCDSAVAYGQSAGSGFNPRTRVGCDGGHNDRGGLVRVVSIHAPAWGATRQDAEQKEREHYVSIHAPAWGATPPCARIVIGGFLFQSTHPRGVRQEHRALYGSRYVVSIHAPAWGATEADCGLF